MTLTNLTLSVYALWRFGGGPITAREMAQQLVGCWVLSDAPAAMTLAEVRNRVTPRMKLSLGASLRHALRSGYVAGEYVHPAVRWKLTAAGRRYAEWLRDHSREQLEAELARPIKP